MNIEIEVYKLRSDAILPEYSHEGDSGFKLAALDDFELFPGQTKVVGLGWACRMPEGYELQIRSRSGLATESPTAEGNKGSGVVVAQGIGTIDNNYRGEVGVLLYNRGYKGKLEFKRGDNIAQGVPAEVTYATFKEITYFDAQETTRGTGGYGSTDVVNV